jgi:hypothetical protein
MGVHSARGGKKNRNVIDFFYDRAGRFPFLPAEKTRTYKRQGNI